MTIWYTGTTHRWFVQYIKCPL